MMQMQCKVQLRVRRERGKKKGTKRREKDQLSRWKSTGEVDKLRRYCTKVHETVHQGDGGKQRGRRKEGEPRTPYWFGVGCPPRHLPRYATRARDVTRSVTRAPWAFGHVSRHALAAASPLCSLHPPLVPTLPPRRSSVPLSRRKLCAATHFERRVCIVRIRICMCVRTYRFNRVADYASN